MGSRKKRYKVKEHQLYTVKSSVWRKLKRENRIDKIYRNRARKIGMASRIFNPGFSLQTAIYRKRLKKISFIGHPPVFIIGLWRSGTTHLHYMMARDNQFGYLNNHQAFTFNFSLLSLNKLNKILNIFVPGRRPQDNVRLTLDDPAEEEQPFSTMTSRSSIHSFFFPRNQGYFTKYHLFEGISAAEKKAWGEDYNFLLQNIAYYNGKRDLLLKNPHNTGRVKELLELYPDAKFIFIHRDPYTIFQSTKKLYMQMIYTQFLQFCSQKEIENLIIENNARIIRKYLDERELIPEGNLIEIGFSDLEKEPMDLLSQIYTALGLGGFKEAKPGVEEYLYSVKSYKKNIFKQIPARLRRKIEERWGAYFEEFGYGRVR